MNELNESLIMPDDFSLERREIISAKVSLGECKAESIELGKLEIEIREPKLKQSPTIIENVELTRRTPRGSTGSLF